MSRHRLSNQAEQDIEAILEWTDMAWTSDVASPMTIGSATRAKAVLIRAS
jgi:hypothetical protein